MRKLLIGMAVALTAVLGTASPARADLELQITVDGGPTQTFTSASGGTATTGGTIHFTGVDIQANTSSNSPGSPLSAFLVGSTLQVTMTDNAAHTISVSVGDTGFTQPLGGNFTSQLGGTINSLGNLFAGSTLTFQSYIDPNNGQNTAGSITPGAQTTFKTGGPGASGSFALNDASTGASGLTVPPGYSITSNYTLNVAAGSNNSQLNLTTSASLTAVPAPAGLLLLGAAAPVLGLGYLRHRKAAVKA
jgi:hypothetical protein